MNSIKVFHFSTIFGVKMQAFCLFRSRKGGERRAETTAEAVAAKTKVTYEMFDLPLKKKKKKGF